MTDAELSARMREGLITFKRLQADRAPLRHLAPPGVHAFALPSHAAYLHQQQVLYTDAAALADALGTLEAFYRGLAIPAWRVGVPEGDAEAQRLLARAGYGPGEVVPVMGLELEASALPTPARPLERPSSLESLVALNVESFGPQMDYLEAWHPRTPAPLHVLELREEGRTLAGGLALDVEEVASIFLVATAPAARRRGLASDIMWGLLAEALARGRAAAVLQSTPMGYGLYQHLGFRDVDRWRNWVRRPSP